MGLADVQRTFVESYTRGLRDPRTWAATGYVMASFFTTLGLFIVAALAVVPALALCVIGVGIPLTVGAMVIIHRLIGIDRRLAGLIGRRVDARPLGTGSIRSRFRDASAWRHIGFAMSAWLVSSLFFTAMLVVWAGPLYLISIPIWGWALDASWTRLALMPVVGLGLLGVAPIAARGLASLYRSYVNATVGPDRVAEMQQQVTEISESRSEILHAVAGERRRIERNLHDGVQQQLVALGIDLGLAESKLDTDPEAARALLAEATKKTRESIGELRSIGRGLHPAILGDRGLDAALSATAGNASVPVELRSELTIEPPAEIGEAAYFVVSEALTNVMKHSKANLAVVTARSTPSELLVSVYDDGRGGATLTGTGLAGIAARVRGFGGTFDLQSPPGGPTVVTVTFPYES